MCVDTLVQESILGLIYWWLHIEAKTLCICVHIASAVYGGMKYSFGHTVLHEKYWIYFHWYLQLECSGPLN